MIEDNSRKLGFGALVAIVFGMMVGSGIYNIPQNMAVKLCAPPPLTIIPVSFHFPKRFL